MLSATRTAQLYLQHIWKHHGLPKKVVLDRGPQFVAEFTKELYQILRIKLAATTAYHPQGDGQTERVNQELEQYLHLFTNQRQDDWDDLLPIAEFQYNNHVHTVTQAVPFLLDTGWIPWMGFEPDQRQSHVESINVRGHLRAPTSQMEYVRLTTPDKLHLADTPYIPPHRQRPHLSPLIASPF